MAARRDRVGPQRGSARQTAAGATAGRLRRVCREGGRRRTGRAVFLAHRAGDGSALTRLQAGENASATDSSTWRAKKGKTRRADNSTMLEKMLQSSQARPFPLPMSAGPGERDSPRRSAAEGDRRRRRGERERRESSDDEDDTLLDETEEDDRDDEPVESLQPGQRNLLWPSTCLRALRPRSASFAARIASAVPGLASQLAPS